MPRVQKRNSRRGIAGAIARLCLSCSRLGLVFASGTISYNAAISATDTISYSAAISACKKGEQPEKALELIEDMQWRGLDARMITYNAAISACE